MMRRISGLLLCCLLALTPASAQIALPFPGPGKAHSTGGGVTGWCSLVPQTGLTHCYPFDTTYTSTSVGQDPIGSANVAFTNVTLAGSGPSTNLNNAAIFNGSSAFGQSTFAGPVGTAWSIVTWLKVSTFVGGARFMANCHTDSDNNGFQASLFTGNKIDTTIGNGTTFSDVTTAGTFVVGTWIMVTMVYSSPTLTVYLNATSSGSTSVTGPITSCATNVAFGYNPSYAGDFYTGQIAGTAFYSRALTGGEVTTINGL